MSFDSLEGFNELKMLGKGAHGSAHLVERRSDGERFVVKKVRLSSMADHELNIAQREVRHLMQCSSPHVVKYYGSFADEHTLYVFMENCESGTLEQAIRAKEAVGHACDTEVALDYFAQICVGLQAVHALAIVHRDIKPANIFLTRRNLVKIGDFGVSFQLGSTQPMATTCVGTPLFLSPEQLQGQPYSVTADIWALGVLLFRMCFGAYPYNAPNLPTLAMRVCCGGPPPIPESAEVELAALIRSLLTVDPLHRPTIEAVITTPLVQRHVMHLSFELRQLASSTSEIEQLSGQMGASARSASYSSEQRTLQPSQTLSAASGAARVPRPDVMPPHPSAVHPTVPAADYKRVVRYCTERHDELLMVCVADKVRQVAVRRGRGALLTLRRSTRIVAVTRQRLLVMRPRGERSDWALQRHRPARDAHWLDLEGLASGLAPDGSQLELSFSRRRSVGGGASAADARALLPLRGSDGAEDALQHEGDGQGGAGAHPPWRLVISILPPVTSALLRSIAHAAHAVRRDLAVISASLATPSLLSAWQLSVEDHALMATRGAEDALRARRRPGREYRAALRTLGSWHGSCAETLAFVTARLEPLLAARAPSLQLGEVVASAAEAGARPSPARPTETRAAEPHAPHPLGATFAGGTSLGARAQPRALSAPELSALRAALGVLAGCDWLEELHADSRVPVAALASDLAELVRVHPPQLRVLGVAAPPPRALQTLAHATSLHGVELRVSQPLPIRRSASSVLSARLTGRSTPESMPTSARLRVLSPRAAASTADGSQSTDTSLEPTNWSPAADSAAPAAAAAALADLAVATPSARTSAGHGDTRGDPQVLSAATFALGRAPRQPARSSRDVSTEACLLSASSAAPSAASPSRSPPRLAHFESASAPDLAPLDTDDAHAGADVPPDRGFSPLLSSSSSWFEAPQLEQHKLPAAAAATEPRKHAWSVARDGSRKALGLALTTLAVLALLGARWLSAGDVFGLHAAVGPELQRVASSAKRSTPHSFPQHDGGLGALDAAFVSALAHALGDPFTDQLRYLGGALRTRLHSMHMA